MVIGWALGRTLQAKLALRAPAVTPECLLL